jgi:hypothetical protein
MIRCGATTACLLVLGLGPAAAQSGTVDAFGYTVRSSTNGGSEYDYVPLVAGTFVPLEDENARLIQLPFVFNYYGTAYTSVEIHSNGALTFGATFAISLSHDCKDTTTAIPTIWGWWDDLNPGAFTLPVPGVYRATLGTGVDRYFAVEFFQVPLFGIEDPITFEIKLFEADGRIEVHYADTQTADNGRSNGGGAVAGITGGADPLVFSCDEATLSGNFALTYYPPCPDIDGDGFCPGPAPEPEDEDCDDGDSEVHPGADERCNGVDDDCDGQVPADEADADGDGERGCDGDCDDDDPDRNTRATELCNGIDDDCSGAPVDAELDLDGDGQRACDGDCDDADPRANTLDLDGDGVDGCSGDCDDEDDEVSPEESEVCDGKDNDCDGDVDEGEECLGVGKVPYGCLLSCSATERGGGERAWLLLPLLAVRRRSRRADPAP